MGFRGGGVKLTPPSVSWFSSTPAGIGLKLHADWLNFNFFLGYRMRIKIISGLVKPGV